MKNGLNPKVRDFIEDSDITLLGMFWSMYWRFLAFVIIVIFIPLALISNLYN